MLRKNLLISMIFALMISLALIGCSNQSSKHTAKATTKTKTSQSSQNGNTAQAPSFAINLGGTKIYDQGIKPVDPKKFPKDTETGEPSTIHYFQPPKGEDEGDYPRVYPNYDNKTFKFLSVTTTLIAPQDYYMFQQHQMDKLMQGTGYKMVSFLDAGRTKVLPNLELGYYDFAWVPLSLMTEYWSGQTPIHPELWRGGNDYVVIGDSYDGGTSLLVPPNVTSLKQFDGQTIGIMTPQFNIESMFNKKLKEVGLATKNDGGTVSVVMGTPGTIMNEMAQNKVKGIFAWGIYGELLKKQYGYKELLPWEDFGYGNKDPYFVLVARKDIVQKHPDIVQKVVQANYDATQEALTKGDFKAPEIQRLEAYWKSTYKNLNRKVADLNDKHFVSTDAEINPVFMKDMYNYMEKSHYFKSPHKYSDIVDLSFQDKIVK